MDRREHIARQAADAVDTVIERQERGEPADPAEGLIMSANLTAAREAGIHPFELDQYRRTAPDRTTS